MVADGDDLYEEPYVDPAGTERESDDGRATATGITSAGDTSNDDECDDEAAAAGDASPPPPREVRDDPRSQRANDVPRPD